MVKVITYGTYDLLHYGHIRLLERAKALGDYLIVGVTADDFDKTRGKINVQQPLMERIEAIKATGLADEIIVEEYEGQKIDDIQRLEVDIFTVGSDWEGYFDYLKEYCKVVYLPRTHGVSSSEIREEKRKLRLGIIGGSTVALKYAKECCFVNGIELTGVYESYKLTSLKNEFNYQVYNCLDDLLSNVDAVYIDSHPKYHYEHIKQALQKKKHVLCESPIALSESECQELFRIADKNGCILMDAIKTAYSTAFSRLMLLVKSGRIGDVVSIDVTCTSLKDLEDVSRPLSEKWSSILAWGPTALLPIFQLLGTDYKNNQIISRFSDKDDSFDTFTRMNFIYANATASATVAKGVKSEGELIISGTKGYIYVPAPWWKMDYFEIRFENAEDNKRYFYQLDGEGIRYELVAFVKSIESTRLPYYILPYISESICKTVQSTKNNTIINI